MGEKELLLAIFCHQVKLLVLKLGFIPLSCWGPMKMLKGLRLLPRQ